MDFFDMSGVVGPRELRVRSRMTGFELGLAKSEKNRNSQSGLRSKVHSRTVKSKVSRVRTFRSNGGKTSKGLTGR